MNKIMNEYLKNIHNKEENLNEIKRRIQDQKQKKLKIINIAAVILVVVLFGALSPQIYAKVQQNKKYAEYTRRNYVSGKGEIATAYSEKIEMDYVYQNDIGVKIDSIILTDDSFKANVNLKLPEKMRIDKLPENNNDKTSIFYGFGFAVYDEKKHIFDVSNRIDDVTLQNGFGDYLMCLYKELGIKFNKYNPTAKILSNGGGIGTVEKDDEKITYQLELNSLEGFPNSEKIYIRIFNIGYAFYSDNSENDYYSEHNDLEWIFEIETPDKFLKRETINLVLLDEIPRLKINLFTVSETGMILKGQKKDVVDMMAARKRYG